MYKFLLNENFSGDLPVVKNTITSLTLSFVFLIFPVKASALNPLVLSETFFPVEMASLYANVLDCADFIDPITNTAYVETFSKLNNSKLEELQNIPLFSETFIKGSSRQTDTSTEDLELICGDAFAFSEGVLHGEIIERNYKNIVTESHELTPVIVALISANFVTCEHWLTEKLGSTPINNYTTLMRNTFNFLQEIDGFIDLYQQRFDENNSLPDDLFLERCNATKGYILGFNLGIRNLSDIKEEIFRVAEEKRAVEEEKKRLEEEKIARRIEGFNDEQSSFIHDALAPYYVNYRNFKATCLKEGAAPYAEEVKKLFAVMKQAVDQGEVEFPNQTSWDEITDAAWEVSTPEHQKWLDENSMLIAIYDSLPDRDRINKCIDEVLPGSLQLIRMTTKQFEKQLTKTDITKEKKDF